ncbi:inter-alpha-trypsin inhibitor heavy chain H4-like [Maniola jurtina]|uniref:inter-alpha-trypsin inhibitor heavy chain H4-like n=1 Tax=Maniola jurtina TaxID=191418 RepID=UPI001E68EB28|nr:inter-alpha-trypsin inhibitor heavy chain H4-like [Maniola jurtina]
MSSHHSFEVTIKSTVSTEVTTPEKPIVSIKLTEMRVRSEVALRYARTSVLTHVHNPDARPQEVTFRMLLPDTAFISGFTMILDGKSYKAYVKEKEEAKKIYNQAVSQGISAAYVATKARDSNQFVVSANVEGNTTAVFDLRYEEFLERRNGLYNHDINLHPGTLVPKLEVVVHIRESQKITKLHVPEIRTGNEVDATEEDRQNSKAVIVRGADKGEITITFTPDLEEQKRLAEIYVEKTKEKSSPGRNTSDKENKRDSTALGQFVVQYDVEQSNNGEIFVNEGYFGHFFAPSSLYPLSKYVVFVLDTSGSMMGRKIEQLHSAMNAILSDLNPNDRFSMVEFNYGVTVHDLNKTDQAAPTRSPIILNPNVNSLNTSVTLVPPFIASPENIAKAKVIVSKLKASGGTNIYDALDVALNLVIKGVDLETEKDLISEESDCDVGYYYDDLLEEYYELEPVIIFLTDGEPTVAETNTNRIISYITEKNSGDNRASLYSLAFGESADRAFLRKLSLRNEGFMRHIYEAADAALQLHHFYRQVSSPLLSHVQFFYPQEQIKEETVSRNRFRVINAGSEVVVVGQIEEDATEITPQVTGFYGSENGLGRIRYEVFPRVPVKCRKDNYLPLERMWAHLTIKQLLDLRDAGDDQSTNATSAAEKQALALALKYEFVTPLTSLVVVKPNATNSVDVESVDKLPTQTNFALGASSAQFAPASMIVNRRAPALSKAAPARAATPAVLSKQKAVSVADGVTASPTAPSVQGSPVASLAPPAPAVSPGADYHLEEFMWTTAILDNTADALVIDDNGIKVLKLTKDVNPPKEAGGDGECLNRLPLAAQAAAGVNATSVCVYLTRCNAARNITPEEYRDSCCFINNRFAGVCCPKNEVDII